MKPGFSAYHAGSWSAHRPSHELEMVRGALWTPCGQDSEFGLLESVLLYHPALTAPRISSPERVQHLRAIDWSLFRKQARQLAKTFQQLGVRVEYLRAAAFPGTRPNLMFTRDLFFPTPWGAVLARMAGPVRAGEEKWAQLALAEAGIPLLGAIRGRGTFEGADALWLTPRLVLVGVGNRTNREGFRQLKAVLAEFGVAVRQVPLPKKVQHLLGMLQLPGPRLALLRGEIADDSLSAFLRRRGFRICLVPESQEVTERQAMNVVVLGENRVLMPKGCPDFRAQIERAGVTVAAEAEIGQYLNAAGGIACATGILHRLPGKSKAKAGKKKWKTRR